MPFPMMGLKCIASCSLGYDVFNIQPGVSSAWCTRAHVSTHVPTVVHLTMKQKYKILQTVFTVLTTEFTLHDIAGQGT